MSILNNIPFDFSRNPSGNFISILANEEKKPHFVPLFFFPVDGHFPLTVAYVQKLHARYPFNSE